VAWGSREDPCLGYLHSNAVLRGDCALGAKDLSCQRTDFNNLMETRDKVAAKCAQSSPRFAQLTQSSVLVLGEPFRVALILQ
jgi:hypothetical protein